MKKCKKEKTEINEIQGYSPLTNFLFNLFKTCNNMSGAHF